MRLRLYSVDNNNTCKCVYFCVDIISKCVCINTERLMIMNETIFIAWIAV